MLACGTRVGCIRDKEACSRPGGWNANLCTSLLGSLFAAAAAAAPLHCRIQLVEKGPTGRLVGTDYNGNRYYEDESATYSERRLERGSQDRTSQRQRAAPLLRAPLLPRRCAAAFSPRRRCPLTPVAPPTPPHRRNRPQALGHLRRAPHQRLLGDDDPARVARVGQLRQRFSPDGGEPMRVCSVQRKIDRGRGRAGGRESALCVLLDGPGEGRQLPRVLRRGAERQRERGAQAPRRLPRRRRARAPPGGRLAAAVRRRARG